MVVVVVVLSWCVQVWIRGSLPALVGGVTPVVTRSTPVSQLHGQYQCISPSPHTVNTSVSASGDPVVLRRVGWGVVRLGEVLMPSPLFHTVNTSVCFTCTLLTVSVLLQGAVGL